MAQSEDVNGLVLLLQSLSPAEQLKELVEAVKHEQHRQEMAVLDVLSSAMDQGRSGPAGAATAVPIGSRLRSALCVLLPDLRPALGAPKRFAKRSDRHVSFEIGEDWVAVLRNSPQDRLKDIGSVVKIVTGILTTTRLVNWLQLPPPDLPNEQVPSIHNLTAYALLALVSPHPDTAAVLKQSQYLTLFDRALATVVSWLERRPVSRGQLQLATPGPEDADLLRAEALAAMLCLSLNWMSAPSPAGFAAAAVAGMPNLSRCLRFLVQYQGSSCSLSEKALRLAARCSVEKDGLSSGGAAVLTECALELVMDCLPRVWPHDPSSADTTALPSPQQRQDLQLIAEALGLLVATANADPLLFKHARPHPWPPQKLFTLLRALVTPSILLQQQPCLFADPDGSVPESWSGAVVQPRATDPQRRPKAAPRAPAPVAKKAADPSKGAKAAAQAKATNPAPSARPAPATSPAPSAASAGPSAGPSAGSSRPPAKPASSSAASSRAPTGHAPSTQSASPRRAEDPAPHRPPLAKQEALDTHSRGGSSRAVAGHAPPSGSSRSAAARAPARPNPGLSSAAVAAMSAGIAAPRQQAAQAAAQNLAPSKSQSQPVRRGRASPSDSGSETEEEDEEDEEYERGGRKGGLKGGVGTPRGDQSDAAPADRSAEPAESDDDGSDSDSKEDALSGLTVTEAAEAPPTVPHAVPPPILRAQSSPAPRARSNSGTAPPNQVAVPLSLAPFVSHKSQVAGFSSSQQTRTLRVSKGSKAKRLMPLLDPHHSFDDLAALAVQSVDSPLQREASPKSLSLRPFARRSDSPPPVDASSKSPLELAQDVVHPVDSPIAQQRTPVELQSFAYPAPMSPSAPAAELPIHPALSAPQTPSGKPSQPPASSVNPFLNEVKGAELGEKVRAKKEDFQGFDLPFDAYDRHVWRLSRQEVDLDKRSAVQLLQFADSAARSQWELVWSTVAARAWDLLGHVTDGDSALRSHARREAFIPLFVDFLRSHVRFPAALTACLHALERVLFRNKKNTTQLPKAGGITTLLSLLRQYQLSAQIVQPTLAILNRMLFDKPADKQDVLELVSALTIKDVMRAHPDNLRIQLDCIGLMITFSHLGKEILGQMKAAALRPLVSAALLRFPDSKPLKEAAKVALDITSPAGINCSIQ